MPNPTEPQPTQTDEEKAAFIERMARASSQFANLCVDRQMRGASEYGKFAFLGNDVMRMMIEELADAVNYCEMQAVKLLVLQELLEEDMVKKGIEPTKEGDLGIGFESFRGAGEEWQRG